jgi:hypothetical protein
MMHIQLNLIGIAGEADCNAPSRLHEVCLAHRYQTIGSCTYLSESRRERASAQVGLLVVVLTYSGLHTQ